MYKRYFVAIVGTAGSGKTTVLQLLNNMGYTTKDYDTYSVDVIKSSRLVQSKLEEFLGQEIIHQGKIDMKRIGAYFDENMEQEIEFEKWYQPVLGHYIEQDILDNYQSYDEMVFFDVPFLKEKGIEVLFDEVWVIKSDWKTCCTRMQERNGYSYDKAKYLTTRFAQNEMGDFSNMKLFNNDGSIESLKQQIEECLSELNDEGENWRL